MRRFISLSALLFVVMALASCEKGLERFLTGVLKEKMDRMTSVSITRFEASDEKEILEMLDKGKTPSYKDYRFSRFLSREDIETLVEYMNSDLGDETTQISYLNSRLGGSDIKFSQNIDVDKISQQVNSVYLPDENRVFCRVMTEGGKGNFKSVSVESMDPSILKVESYGDDMCNFVLTPVRSGDCVVVMRTEGKESVEKHYNVHISYYIKLQYYVDPFWLANGTYRVKYMAMNLPEGVKGIDVGQNTEGTLKGVVRKIDMRNGDRSFSTVERTRTLQKKGGNATVSLGRSLLRDVTPEVRFFNYDTTATCAIRASKAEKERADSLGVRYSVSRVGSSYQLDILGNSITVDAFQLYLINSAIDRFGCWPVGGEFVKEGEAWYYVFQEHFLAQEMSLSFGVTPKDEKKNYLLAPRFKRAYPQWTASSGVETIVDTEFVDEAEVVVDDLGRKFGAYFIYSPMLVELSNDLH